MEHQRYKVIERLDAGGMAEVFRGVAESTVGGLKRSVAIKRVLPKLTSNKKFVQMFLDEARLSMQLQHANVVQVFDIGVSEVGPGNDPAYFLVMEFVEGANLKVLLEAMKSLGQQIPTSQAIYLIMEICRALSYAHDLNDPETNKPLGIVHRDISPPNILVSKRGEVKLADFGLAKAASQLEHTDPGVVKGKFSYLSPEAASGNDVDRRADVFATGILLYEMLTGKRLFDGETDYKTVQLVRQATVPSISAQNAEVTPELEAIIRKALARDPTARFQRAEDFGDALAQYLFARNMKVTSRDIEQLVQRCLTEAKKNKRAEPGGTLIDNLIQDEIIKFTSLDEVGPEASKRSMDGRGDAPLIPEQFIDPRKWDDGDASQSQSLTSPSSGPRGSTDRLAAAQSLETLLEGPSPNKKPPAPAPRSILPMIAAVIVGALLVLLGFLIVRR